MLKRGLLLAAVAALATLAASSGGAGAATTLVPGVRYERQVRLIGGGPVVLHVLTAPGSGPLHALRPVQSGGTVLGRATVPQIQAAVAARATTAGVNGDLFTWSTGHPSGILLSDGVLAARPNPGRSALVVGVDGSLVVDRLTFAGHWRAVGGPPHPLKELNHALSGPGVALFTRKWGGRTPRIRGSVEVVLGGLPQTTVGGWLDATVVAVRRHGGKPVPAGGAVLQARGSHRATLRAAAPVGAQMRVRLRVRDLPAGALHAIGGGPELVRNGAPVLQPDEWFTLDHLRSRHPRAAIGERADGRLVFVVADGRSSASRGLTNANLARTMVSLGAVTAMGLDGGGSATMSFEGHVFNRPSDGRPRAVANGLFVFYYGIYAPIVGPSALSPNGDGVGDRRVLRAKVVRRSTVDLRVIRPDGTVAWRRQDVVGPGWLKHAVGSPAMPEGTWRWSVEASPQGGGSPSSMTRTFTVDRTLGHLRLSRERLSVPARSGKRLGISVRLSRRAHVAVRISTASGSLRRVVFAGRAGPGRASWSWNGRNQAGRVVPRGIYVVEVRARSKLGTVSLTRRLVVVRAAKRPG